MGRTDAMVQRLPLLYREGELACGLMALAGLQLEILDEEALEVQRAHFFDRVLSLTEAAWLAAILDMPVEEWQTSLNEYRAWVHALRDARLNGGSVTRGALQEFVVRYSEAFQRAVGIRVLPPTSTWGASTEANELVFAENPPVRRTDRMPSLEPLYRFTVTQRGLDPTPAGILLVGLPGGPECVPVIGNLTTGKAMVFLGNVPPGARLWLRPTLSGFVEARLEDEDVTDRVYSVPDLEPGKTWSDFERPARPLTLVPGENELWFLPVAHYDALGLDRFLLGLADLLLTQGRLDQSRFDHALFSQDPVVELRMSWVETEPASFRISLPAGFLLNRAGELEESMAERDRLGHSLNEAVRKLKAAGVKGEVMLAPFAETQGQGDTLRILSAPVFKEVGPTGADSMPDAGGIFEVTGYNDSTFR